MEGQFYYSVDRLNEEIKELVHLGINSVILFGLPDKKDECGSEAYADNGGVQRAVREIKKEFKEVLVVTDVCLCQYTSHGHCGVLENDLLNNDKTLELLGKIALSHAKAGADIMPHQI